MKRIFSMAVAVFAVAALCCTSPASAQNPYCGGGGWGGCGVNFPWGLYGSRVEEVPYFSMFPPVYYSQPVPRSYGWSPFAYPPGTMTPEVTADMPQDLINPYVPQNKESKPAKPTSARTAAYHANTAQLLINPFVKSEEIATTASTRIVSE
ncbi:MAG TPA: hypothetical protein VFE46_13615 [Pirellulales bacterium]|jgi:hypothetical protein|nr:hypothetical protein [Pirellulales bacterium]